MSCIPSTRVSVIVPAYNSRAFISRAIDSALAQTLPELEVLIVDDASSDGTADFVEAKYRDNSRVRTFRLRENRGPAGARNVGIGAAKGEWIAILDADDAWRVERLARLLLHSSESDAVLDNLVGYDAETDVTIGSLFPVFPQGPLTLASVLAPQVSHSQFNFGYLKPILRRDFLVRRSVLYDETLRTSEDLLFYLNLMLEGARTRMVDEGLYLYTMPTGTSKRRNTRPRDDEVRRALERMLEQYRSQLDQEAATLFAQRIEYLRHIAPISEFYHARHARNYSRMALLLARHASVRLEVVSKAVVRLSR